MPTTNHYARWTDHDTECVRNYFDVVPLDILSNLLGRTIGSVMHKAVELDIIQASTLHMHQDAYRELVMSEPFTFLA